MLSPSTSILLTMDEKGTNQRRENGNDLKRKRRGEKVAGPKKIYRCRKEKKDKEKKYS